MGQRIVKISAIEVSQDPDEVLITYSLGSCIGVTVYDPHKKIGGMIHYMLPSSSISPEKAATRPAMFADTGILLLFKKLFDLGARRGNLIIKAAGGSTLMDDKKLFNIGERNFLILRKILWKNNLLMKATDVGGSVSRTLTLDIGTGIVTVKSSRKVTEL